MTGARIATALTEIGIRYRGSRSSSEALLPYFVKEIGSRFLLFLRNADRSAIGWLSRDTGAMEILCDTEFEWLRTAAAIDDDGAGGLCAVTEQPRRLFLLDPRRRLQEEVSLPLPGRPISIQHVEAGFLVGTWKPGGLYLVDRRGNLLWGFCPGGDILLEARWACPTPAGSFYVADAGLHRILEVRWDGRAECRHGIAGTPGHGPSTLCHPSMVDVCRDGSLLVCDTRNHRILKVGTSGSLLWQWPAPSATGERAAQLWMPKCSRELADGGLVVTDTFNFRILILDGHRRILRYFGSTPVDRRSLHFPRSVQVLGGRRFLVADTYNNRVVEMDRKSRIVWQFGGGAGDDRSGSLWWPRRALRLRDGHTVIADGRNNRIVLLDVRGSLERCLTAVMSTGGPPTLRDPHDVERTPEGTLIVTDTGNDRILELTPRGRCLWVFPDGRAREEGWRLADPHQASLSRHQRLIVADTGNHRILVLDRRSRSVREIRRLWTRDGEEMTLCQPRAGCFAYGYLWILDSGNSRVLGVTEDGTVVWHWDGTLRESPLQQVYTPRWMTIMAPDQMVVTDYLHSRVVWLRLERGPSGRNPSA